MVQRHAWVIVVVVFGEFPVGLKSGIFKVVGYEPPFDLPERCRLADNAEDMVDLLLSQQASKPDSPFRTLHDGCRGL
jgi:hypothetical protein